jgi:hypothetical protein
MVAPVKKMREVFVLHPVTEKNLSRFSKFIFVFLESFQKKTGQNWKNNGFVKMGEGGF